MSLEQLESLRNAITNKPPYVSGVIPVSPADLNLFYNTEEATRCVLCLCIPITQSFCLLNIVQMGSFPSRQCGGAQATLRRLRSGDLWYGWRRCVRRNVSQGGQDGRGGFRYQLRLAGVRVVANTQ